MIPPFFFLYLLFLLSFKKKMAITTTILTLLPSLSTLSVYGGLTIGVILVIHILSQLVINECVK